MKEVLVVPANTSSSQAIAKTVADSATLDSVLDSLRQALPEQFGAAKIEPISLRDLRFSRVSRVRIQDGRRERYAFVKIRKPGACKPPTVQRARERIAAEFSALSDVNSKIAGHEGLFTVRPIAYFPEHLALITEEASGGTLRKTLNQPLLWFSRLPLERWTTIFERIGLWVRLFQETKKGVSYISLDEMRSYLDSRLNLLASNGAATRFGPAERDSALRHFDKLCQDVSTDELREVPVHADLCPDNVLVNGTDISVLDFSTVGTGTLYHDLAYMFINVESVKSRPWIADSAIDQVLTAMLRAYDPELSPDRPLFRLMELQHIVCRLVQMTTTSPPLLKSWYRTYAWRRYWTWLRQQSS